jgi:CRISPR-associated protein Cmx8
VTPRKAPKKEDVASVSVKYDLFDLPTAQHKAGLAGLVLQLRHMAGLPKRFAPEDIPRLELTPTTATVQFTERSVQRLFDELYAASVEQVRVKSKWQNATPVGEEVVEELDTTTNKTKKVRYFFYAQVQPCGNFLRQHLPEMEKGKDWNKLWRDMLWAIPRGNPQSRIPFEQRAADQPCREGQNAWQELVAVERARRDNRFFSTEVAGSLWLGAQAVNAEGVPFQGRAEQNLLLHFWSLAVLVFVPQRIDNDGTTEFAGYALAIPEVADLDRFCEDYLSLLHNLRTEVRGFRPAAAVIDLPDQAALEFLEDLARLTHYTVGKKVIIESVSAVEFLHLMKQGNNVRALASGRVAPRPALLDAYLAISSAEAPIYRNPLFRSGLLRSLLRDRPWYEGLAPLLSERPWPFFVRSVDTPRTMPWFASDAAKMFQALLDNFQHEVEEHTAMAKQAPEEAGPVPQAALDLLIFRLVRNYVQRRAEEKSGLTWDSFKDRKIKDERTGKERIDVPQEYLDAREKVASSTFLAMRSRREQDFVDHFTATFCSLRQFLPEEDFSVVAEALLHRSDDVKALTLLALSANS